MKSSCLVKLNGIFMKNQRERESVFIKVSLPKSKGRYKNSGFQHRLMMRKNKK